MIASEPQPQRDPAKQLEQSVTQLHKQMSVVSAVKASPDEMHMPPQPADTDTLRLQAVEASNLRFEHALYDEDTAIAARELRCYVRVSLWVQSRTKFLGALTNIMHAACVLVRSCQNVLSLQIIVLL